MVGTTRRGLLAAAASAGLAGCGASSKQGSNGPRAVTDTGHKGDVELLQALHTVKAEAVKAYGTRGPLGTVAKQEIAHLDALDSAIAKAGGPKPANTFTIVGTPETLAQAHARELDMIALGIDTLPKLADPKLRVLVSSMLTADGEHLAAITLTQRGDPVPEAFIYGARA